MSKIKGVTKDPLIYNKGRYRIARKYGYRSGLEVDQIQKLKSLGIDFGYESEKIHFVQPAKKRSYTPDIVFKKKDGTKMYIELKGEWVRDDRLKHVMIHEQYPGIDIRYVFTRSTDKISKVSKTTYGDYCTDRGWLYADEEIPAEWLNEVKRGD